MKFTNDELLALAALPDDKLWAEIEKIASSYGIKLPDKTPSHEELEKLKAEDITDLLIERADKLYEAKEKLFAENDVDMREVERVVLLRNVDEKWMEHIDNMDQLRDGIGLRAYGQTDPVQAFRKESFDIFEDMVNSIKRDTVALLFRVSIQNKVERKQTMNPLESTHGNKGEAPKKNKPEDNKVGRNSPCPCGSGKKYKNCCGRGM